MPGSKQGCRFPGEGRAQRGGLSPSGGTCPKPELHEAFVGNEEFNVLEIKMGDFALIGLFQGSFRVAFHSCGMWLTTSGLAVPAAGLSPSSLCQSYSGRACARGSAAEL